MRKVTVILLLAFLAFPAVSGQKLEFGIQFTPLEFSSLTFDQKYIVFDDYTSYKLNTQGLRLAIPSLSNSGLYVRYPFGNHLALQSGLAFQNNVYYYSVNETYQSTLRSFFYSSIDVPVFFSYTLSESAKLKLRLLAGANVKNFKIRRNYYSIFAQSLDVFFNQQDAESDTQKRDFIISKVNPFMIYSRIGTGLSYYNFTLDLCADKNLTTMNRKPDAYNANFKDSFQLTLVLGIRLSNKDLKVTKKQDKIIKQ
jgi:hypothetical protein